MNQKHTPGPWHVDVSKSFYVFACGSLAEQAGVGNGPFICNASTQENARLIAAAPELLSALRIAEDFMSGFEDDEVQEGMVTKLAGIRAAITKATGEEWQ
ncbi:MAG: hypothetical protein AB1642_00990 [Pseudomonadota bacterium]